MKEMLMDLIKINDTVDDLITDLSDPEESSAPYKAKACELLKIKDVIMRMLLPAVPPEAALLETFYSDFYRILGSSSTVHKKAEELLSLKKKLNAPGNPVLCGAVDDVPGFYGIFQIGTRHHKRINRRNPVRLILLNWKGKREEN